MSYLNAVITVRNALKTSSKASVILLHKYIFEHEGDKGNRKRLREFAGFTFDENSEEYRRKCVYINNKLNSRDLIIICALLSLTHNEEDIKLHIFRNLRKDRLIQDVPKNDDNDDNDVSDDGVNDLDGEDDATNDENMNDAMIRVNLQDHRHDANDDNDDRNDDDEIQTQVRHDDVSTIQSGRSLQNVSGIRRASTKQQQKPRFVMNFRDVEDSVTPFDGSNTVPIEAWFDEFEETAVLLGWDQLQTLIFAKKSLKSLAKLFIAGGRGLTSWIKLKTALLNEFRSKVDSRQVHKLLTDRTMRKDERVLEYLYKMKAFETRGKIDERAIIHYVIDGIKDANSNKQILYGAHTLQEFKEKLQDYEIYSTKQCHVNERGQTENRTTINKAAATTKTAGNIKKHIDKHQT